MVGGIIKVRSVAPVHEDVVLDAEKGAGAGTRIEREGSDKEQVDEWVGIMCVRAKQRVSLGAREGVEGKKKWKKQPG